MCWSSSKHLKFTKDKDQHIFMSRFLAISVWLSYMDSTMTHCYWKISPILELTIWLHLKDCFINTTQGHHFRKKLVSRSSSISFKVACMAFLGYKQAVTNDGYCYLLCLYMYNVIDLLFSIFFIISYSLKKKWASIWYVRV